MTPTKTALAELIGTFMFVFLGAGAVALSGPANTGILGVAFAHGLALLVIAYAFGPVSGAHVNPAVTFALVLTRKIPIQQAVRYWIAQFIGAALAAYLLQYLLGANGGNLGQTVGQLTTADPVKAMVVEAVLTFFLMIAVYGSGVSGRNGNAYGIAIGLVLTADIIFGGYLTGASMNPARSFGPFLVLQQWEHFYIYIVGPCIGAGVAAVIYDALYMDRVKV